MTKVFNQDGFVIASDADILGGSKRAALERYLKCVLERRAFAEFVYATPAQGFAQIALSAACKLYGKDATLFVAKRNTLHERTRVAQSLGANIIEVPMGFLSNISAKARVYASARVSRFLVPFGLDDPIFIQALSDHARAAVKSDPPEVRCAAGSGVLTRALQKAFPSAKHYAISVGANSNFGNATVIKAGVPFDRDAKIKPPFDSCANYDAKVWAFMKERAQPGALYWNVAGDRVPAYNEVVVPARARLRERAQQIRKGVIA